MMTRWKVLTGSSLATIACSVMTLALMQDAPAIAKTNAPCTPKTITVKGHSGIGFCGPATATIKAGGRTYSYQDGFCAHDVKHTLALQLSLGTDILVLGGGKANLGRPYLSLALGTAHRKGILLAVDFDGRELVKADTHVKGKYNASAAERGRFAGKGVSGSWDCNGSIYQDDQG